MAKWKLGKGVPSLFTYVIDQAYSLIVWHDTNNVYVWLSDLYGHLIQISRSNLRNPVWIDHRRWEVENDRENDRFLPIIFGLSFSLGKNRLSMRGQKPNIFT